VLARRGAYFPYVDGLRALAVASVIAYHAFPRTAHGGFIGVDIFFVISGYLITSHIAEEVDAGRFSFAQFYGRRIRRIFPALAAVLAASLLFGALALDPSEYRELSLQAASSTGFFSNILFWLQAGYFDENAAYKPLLHLWSLAVEEQFYILWPLALVFAAGWFGGTRWRLAAGLAAISFAINLALAAADPVADFYLLVSRAWELLIGALLALAPDMPSASGRAREALSIGGLLLIVLGLKTTYSSQAFPGYAALAPTLGAVGLIAAGPGAMINRRLLSLGPITYIGRISYSAYLWHWPLLSFSRICAGGELGPPVRRG
jgi:peptidoglycan/LPS O-acetylase OafA/YrhL